VGDDDSSTALVLLGPIDGTAVGQKVQDADSDIILQFDRRYAG